MTNDNTKAPERIWIEGAVKNKAWEDTEAKFLSPHGPYIRHDLHLAAVAEAYEDAADKVHEECWTDGDQDNVTAEVLAEQATTSLAVRTINASTPDDAIAAREARDKRIREEALREAAEEAGRIAERYLPTATSDYSAGFSDGADMAESAILALIEKDKTDE